MGSVIELSAIASAVHLDAFIWVRSFGYQGPNPDPNLHLDGEHQIPKQLCLGAISA